MAEMAIRLAYVKRISACEAGLNSAVAPGALPLRERGAELGSLASLAPGWWLQTGHVGSGAAASQMAAESSSRRSKRVRLYNHR